MIKILINILNEHGNLEVFMSADTEGNSFGSFEETGEGFYNIQDGKIVIYPWEDHIGGIK